MNTYTCEDIVSCKRVLTQFHVDDIYELHTIFLESDQKHAKDNTWDTTNNTLLHNRIKDSLMKITQKDLSKLLQHQKEALYTMLWLWHHHATTIAIFKEREITKACLFCDKAMKYLYKGHPNKITPMLSMLLHGNIDAAQTWMKEEVGKNEIEYAHYLLKKNDEGLFAHENKKVLK